VLQHAQFVWQVVLLAQDWPNVISVKLGLPLLQVVPLPHKLALAVALAASVNLDRQHAQTAGVDTTLMVQWLALLALQEPSLQVLAAEASLIAPNVWLDSMLQLDLSAALHALRDGMLNHLGQAAVLPAQQVVS
jgi:hypothetical protein